MLLSSAPSSNKEWMVCQLWHCSIINLAMKPFVSVTPDHLDRINHDFLNIRTSCGLIISSETFCSDMWKVVPDITICCGGSLNKFLSNCAASLTVGTTPSCDTDCWAWVLIISTFSCWISATWRVSTWVSFFCWDAAISKALEEPIPSRLSCGFHPCFCLLSSSVSYPCRLVSHFCTLSSDVTIDKMLHYG